MSVRVIDTIKPQTNGFPVVEAVDVAVDATARLPAALAAKADVTTAENLQGQINQIVISSAAEAVVAPEVAQARVGADSTEYDTLKERLDGENGDIKESMNVQSKLLDTGVTVQIQYAATSTQYILDHLLIKSNHTYTISFTKPTVSGIKIWIGLQDDGGNLCDNLEISSTTVLSEYQINPIRGSSDARFFVVGSTDSSGAYEFTITDVTEKYNSVNNILLDNNTMLNDWLFAGINMSTGKTQQLSNIEYRTRLVYNNYIDVTKMQSVCVDSSDYEINLVAFDKTTEAVVLSTGWTKQYIFSENSAYNWKLLMRRVDDEPMEMSEIRHVIFHPYVSNRSRVVVCSSQSQVSQSVKAEADYICGDDARPTLQKAIESLFRGGGGEVLLRTGDYVFKSLYEYTNDDDVTEYYGLYAPIDTPHFNLIIKGETPPTRIGNHQTGNNGNDVSFWISSAALSETEFTDKISVIGALEKRYPKLHAYIENLGINIGSTKYATIGVNMENFAACEVKKVFVTTPDTVEYDYEPNPEMIGIRGLPGWNMGSIYTIEDCFVWNHGVAFDIGGEHLIMSRCGCRYCDITYRFNGYDDATKMSHPNTLINCCEEQCSRSLYFCESDTKQDINLIDFNIEYRPTAGNHWSRTTKAVEERPGDYRGTITYSANGGDYINSESIQFWESGSGLNIMTRNVTDKFAGTTSERPQYPAMSQSFFDKTINKPIIWNGTEWIDYTGNEV